MKTVFVAAMAVLLASGASARTITVAAGADAQTRLQEALIVAEPGDVIELGEGRFTLTDGLSLAVDRVTIRGAGMQRTILDFTGQLGAGEGLLITSDDVVLRDFAVENSRGDGIKSRGADRIVYYRVRVEWTAGPRTENGAYGIYPVESEHVLVDGVVVRGASDAGIYVGQSRNIIVRESVAVENVAGIEIENSFNADVHDNVASQNTGGILVFDLPGLPQQGGHSVRIFDNVIINNMTRNFAPAGNIVASVPAGTGVIVMANRDVEIFDNVFDGNGTSDIMITGYRFGAGSPGYQPLPTRIRTFDNLHGRAGFQPDLPGGTQMAAAFGGALPPVLWDGAGSEISVQRGIAAMTLGLSDLTQPREAARPAPVDLAAPATWPRVTRVILPASMEAAVAQ